MELLDKYFEMQKEIHKYFGYVENWVAIPLDDATSFFWYLDESEVRFAEKKENVFSGTDEDGYSNEIYTQRFLKKWVYEGEDYTMVCVDTHVDGNKFLQVFANNKRLTTPTTEKE